MVKLAYIILSHRGSEQLARLVHTLQAGSSQAQIVIHHDGAKQPLDQTAFQSLANVHILQPFVPITWGTFSMVQAELNAIAWLLDNRVDFDWLILLSGQDYPIQPIADIEAFLATTEYDGFLEYFPATAPPDHMWQWGDYLGIERYYYRYFTVPAQLSWLFYKLYRVVNWQKRMRLRAGPFGARVAIKRHSVPFSDQFRCYAGSQWHTLSYDSVRYLHTHIQAHPELVHYYQQTLVPDESFVQTVLVNNPSLRFYNHNYRYISWQPPYPAIMKGQDFSTLINSGLHFARKFDIAVDSDIFDQLDDHFATSSASPSGEASSTFPQSSVS